MSRLDQYASYIRTNIGTMTYTRIAAAIGENDANVRKWCVENGLARERAWHKMTDSEQDYIRANWRTMSDSAIARQLGRNQSGIADWRYRHGLIKTPGAKPRRQSGQMRAMQSRTVQTVEDKAAEYVASHDRTPVFRVDNNGEPTRRGKMWRYGTARLTTEQLMAKAARKGFDPDAWKRLAA